ncbi:MAG TPA: FHA domain-containing protein, partial [Tepidisphaeraceae bacterium]|nr:FHA domain-containing protein [Tepidisphaeraceae bacterium]
MSLQIRLTHSLGESLIELQPRGADQANVVGRSSGAQVSVPSASVGKQHCLLFVHDGRWVVQDASSQAGTYLNGERITEPSYLNTGDMITLGGGSNAPSVVIDPHGIGVSEEDAAQPAAVAHVPQPAAAALPQP